MIICVSHPSLFLLSIYFADLLVNVLHNSLLGNPLCFACARRACSARGFPSRRTKEGKSRLFRPIYPPESIF